MKNFNKNKASLQTLWIKGDNGDTYLCNVRDIKDRHNVTAEELSRCVNESENPQND